MLTSRGILANKYEDTRECISSLLPWNLSIFGNGIKNENVQGLQITRYIGMFYNINYFTNMKLFRNFS